MNRAATKLAALDATFAVIPDTGKQVMTKKRSTVYAGPMGDIHTTASDLC